MTSAHLKDTRNNNIAHIKRKEKLKNEINEAKKTEKAKNQLKKSLSH